MDGWYLGGSQGWFGSILSVDSPPHWATVCSLKAEPTSVLCSNHPPLLKGLASLQPAIAFCPVPSCGPHGTLGMKSAKNQWPPCTGHRNWRLPGQCRCQAWTFRLASPGLLRYLSSHRLLLLSQPPAGRGARPPQTLKAPQPKTGSQETLRPDLGLGVRSLILSISQHR